MVVIVVLSYIGNDGGRLFFGLCDYLGVGTSVCFAVVTPLIFLTYLTGGNILIFVSYSLLAPPSVLLSLCRRPCSAWWAPGCSSPSPSSPTTPTLTHNMEHQLVRYWLG